MKFDSATSLHLQLFSSLLVCSQSSLCLLRIYSSFQLQWPTAPHSPRVTAKCAAAMVANIFAACARTCMTTLNRVSSAELQVRCRVHLVHLKHRQNEAYASSASSDRAWRNASIAPRGRYLNGETENLTPNCFSFLLRSNCSKETRFSRFWVKRPDD